MTTSVASMTPANQQFGVLNYFRVEFVVTERWVHLFLGIKKFLDCIQKPPHFTSNLAICQQNFQVTVSESTFLNSLQSAVGQLENLSHFTWIFFIYLNQPT
jgi:hypothetical protein